MTPDQIKVAREWAQDCQWCESPEEITGLTDLEIVREVERHFEGGVTAFTLTM